KQPVDVVMKSFVDQAGAPLLHVSEACVDGERRVTIEQQRLTIAGSKVEGAWTLPLCPRGEACRIVSQKSETVALKGCDAPLFLSREGAGYFAVEYASDERAKLRARLRDLTPAERISLWGNEWLLTRNLRQHVGEYLALLRDMPRPADRPLVIAIADTLAFFDRRLVNETNRAAWEQYVRAALQGYAPLTWENAPNETAEQRIVRDDVLSTLGETARD